MNKDDLIYGIYRNIGYTPSMYQEMISIINRLIDMRNSGIKSKEMSELDKKNHGLIKQRKNLLDAQRFGMDIKGLFDYIMNQVKQFELYFRENRLEPFSLEQILDLDFYPDSENYPRIVSEYRTIKQSPKQGNISRDLIKHAVKVVLSSSDIKN